MKCNACGRDLPVGTRRCPGCDAPRPAPARQFRRVEEEYLRLRAALDAGGLTVEAVTRALHAAAMQEGGRYWMLDPEAGLWHAHDGRAWIRLDPPLIALAERTEATRQIGGGPPPIADSTPARPSRETAEKPPRARKPAKTRTTARAGKTTARVGKAAETASKPVRPRRSDSSTRKPAAARGASPPPVIPGELKREVEALLRAGQKVSAVKAYRDAAGVGLKEAKDAVDAVEAALKASPGDLPPKLSLDRAPPKALFGDLPTTVTPRQPSGPPRDAGPSSRSGRDSGPGRRRDRRDVRRSRRPRPR